MGLIMNRQVLVKFGSLLLTSFLLSNSPLTLAQIWQKSEIQTLAHEIAAAQLKAERQLYSSIDDAIDCEKVPSLDSKRCKDINFILKRNSVSTVRLKDSNGNEVNLPTNTPSEIISFVLNPTIENAITAQHFSKNLLEHEKNKKLISNLAKNLTSQLSNVNSQENSYKRNIKEDSVRITFIVNPDQETSILALQTVKSMMNEYKGVSIGVYFTKGSTEEINNLNNIFNINGQIMTVGQLAATKTSVFPLIWIDNKFLGFRREFKGLPTEPELLDQVEIVSNIQLVKDYLDNNGAK
jgi:hypothetical protein